MENLVNFSSMEQPGPSLISEIDLDNVKPELPESDEPENSKENIEASEEANSESDIDSDEFFFESDHLALRGNSDYTAILRTIAILQTQRIQVTRDIDTLAAAEKEALDDPDAFLLQLTKNEFHMPGPVAVIDLPKINFEKYGVSIPEFVDDEPKSNEALDVTVRGRVFDQTKPETFNQLWTCEEQKRLEELLIEYPPEPIEMRRFAKIARALGNRTTKQVASRLQKFFKKLHSAGMPVPGRIPKSNRTHISRSVRITKQALRPTTFFPANHVPFNITEDDDFSGGVPLDPNWYRKGCSTQSVGSNSNDNDTLTSRTYIVDDEDSDTESVSNDSVEANVLRIVLRVKRDKEKDHKLERAHCEHDGFKCDYCSEEPIIGTRWHCTFCVQSIDFCSDCLVTQIQSDSRHSLEHKFVALRVSSAEPVSLMSQQQSEIDSADDDGIDDDGTDDGGGDGSSGKLNSDPALPSDIYDRDYMANKFLKSDYNYLDPNFLPQ